MRYALLALVACGGAAPRTQAVAAKAEVAAGPAIGVVELGDTVYVFDRDKVTIARGGSIVSRADAPTGKTWIAGATIAAPDGNGRWVVGVADGGLWRISQTGDIEPIADRLGLAGAKALAIASAGAAFGVGLADGAALTGDGVHLARLRGASSPNVAVARGRVALWTSAGVRVLDLARDTEVSYPIADPRFVAFLDADSDASRLVVATGALLYTEDRGALHRVPVPSPIRGVAASGARLWLLAAGALYALDHHGLVRTDAAAADWIYASPSGDVWAARDRGAVTRYTLEAATDGRGWQADVAPVFQRVCAHCHLPGGDAGVDLSTAASWASERDEIARRVLVTRTMPPAGTDLPDADRAALAHWLGAKP